eukprot:TRINITY_DN52238_c0_g1_i1.p1 TRINITY_DN52238_c0_g1~~TRINITY_DN52238_c0_g1_i1.p1  ORF type:complete len:268 (+),score=162.94 TRINITY_DN52238_c0_g1_i1:38-805(+)
MTTNHKRKSDADLEHSAKRHNAGKHAQQRKAEETDDAKQQTTTTTTTTTSSVPSQFLNNKAFVTQPAPFFKQEAVMPDGSFKQVSLDDYKGKWLVLFSYPLDFTFVCPSEIIAFSEAVAEFRKLDCEVAAWSVDSKFSHHAWTQVPRKKGGLGKVEFPLLQDLNREMSRDYGVLIEAGFTLRGLFIIDPKGVIRHVTKNDPPVGRNTDEVLRLVQALQFTDKHGEVCPINWRPGKKTIKADKDKKVEFFEQEYDN